MKIDYNMEKKYFLCYDEAQGIIIRRKSIINHPNIKTYNYIERGLQNLIIIMILSIINCFFGINVSLPLANIINIILLFFYVYLLIYFIRFIFKLSIAKKRQLKGHITINDKGITDYSLSGFELLIKWPKVKLVVIKPTTAVILTDTPIYIFTNIETKNKLEKAFHKYAPDIPIIDKS